MLRIGHSIHQAIQLTSILKPNLVKPTVAIRILIDLLRLILEALIHLDNLTGHRAEHIRSRLDRLRNTGFLATVHGRAHIRNPDINHITQLLLGKIGNADRCRAVICQANPLVGLNVFQVCGYLTHSLVS